MKTENKSYLFIPLLILSSRVKTLRRILLLMKVISTSANYLDQNSQHIKRNIQHRIKEQPIQALVISALIGMVIGSFLKK